MWQDRKKWSIARTAVSLARVAVRVGLRYVAVLSCLVLSCLVLSCLVLGGTCGWSAEEMTKVTFEDNAKELFRARCGACHNPNKKSGGLDLSNYTGVMQGGGSGAVVEPGNADGSYLYRLVAHLDEPHMPPDADRIPDSELAVLKTWIEAGALENRSSTAKIKSRKKMEIAVDPSAGRPATIPVPAKLPLEPHVVGLRETTITAMATSPWAPLVALASQRQIVLYDPSNLQLRGILPFPEGEVHVLKFSRNGSILLAGGGRSAAAGRVVLFDVVSGQRMAVLGDELDTVLAADIDARHKLVALAGPQKMIRVFSVATGELAFEIKKHTDWVTSLEFSPDGVLLATGDRNGGVYVWEALTGREYLTLKAHTAQINALSWRSDSNVLATASDDTTIRLWEMENGTEIKGWGAHGAGVTDAEFLRDGRLASVGRDRVPRLWDQNGAQLLALEATPDVPVAVSVCDESNRVMVGDWSGEVRVHNLADGARSGSLSNNPPRLATRVELATARVTRLEQELVPLTQAAEQLRQQVTAAQAAHQQGLQSQAALQQKVTEQQQAVDRLRAEQSQLAALVETLRQRIATLNTTLPGLRDIVRQTDAVAQQASSDAALQQLAAQSRTVLAQQEAELNQHAQELVMQEQQQDANATSVAVASAAAQTLQQQVTEAEKQAAELAQAITPVTAQLTAANEACAPKAAELASAQAELAQWQAALAFVQQYQTLQAKIKATEAERITRLAEVDQAEAAARDAAAMLSTKQQAASTVEQQMTELESELAALQGISRP